MRCILLSLALLCSTSWADNVTELNKPVRCISPKVLFSGLKETYGEVPQIMGKNVSDELNTAIIITINVETQTWTMIESSKNLSCVLASGKGLIVKDSKPKNML